MHITINAFLTSVYLDDYITSSKFEFLDCSPHTIHVGYLATAVFVSSRYSTIIAACVYKQIIALHAAATVIASIKELFAASRKIFSDTKCHPDTGNAYQCRG